MRAKRALVARLKEEQKAAKDYLLGAWQAHVAERRAAAMEHAKEIEQYRKWKAKEQDKIQGKVQEMNRKLNAKGVRHTRAKHAPHVVGIERTNADVSLIVCADLSLSLSLSAGVWSRIVP